MPRRSGLGSFDSLKRSFRRLRPGASAPAGRGSCWKKDGELAIYSTPNQDSPTAGRHVFGSRRLGARYYEVPEPRPEYIAAFLNVVNWDKVNELYKAAKA